VNKYLDFERKTVTTSVVSLNFCMKCKKSILFYVNMSFLVDNGLIKEYNIYK